MGKSNLETGLAALKKGDYQTAIAQLEHVSEVELHESTRLRAEMGLVEAYQQMGDRDSARKLCESLIQSQNARAKKWAMAKLKELGPSSDPSRSSSPAGDRSVQNTDPTGFMPFESPASPPTSPTNPAAKQNPWGLV